jgi:hypothetical protein
VDLEKNLECFDLVKHSNKHWADTEYVHERTLYTTLHWLAYHNDYGTIIYIIRHIDANSQNKRQSFVKLMQRTFYHRLTPMCIAGSKECSEAMLEFIHFFIEEKNKAIMLDILPKSKDHGMPSGSSQIPLTRFWDDKLEEDQ